MSVYVVGDMSLIEECQRPSELRSVPAQQDVLERLSSFSFVSNFSMVSLV